MGWPRVVKDQQQAGPRQVVDVIGLDLEVAAIHQCVSALEQLQPESVERVLAYVQARFRPHHFEE